jgi:TP901 family phage tail tape measure protein
MATPGAIRAGRAFVELSADRSPLLRGLRTAERDLQAFASKARGLATVGAAIGAAIGAPLALATRTFVSFGDQLDKAAARTGLSVEALSELDFAAAQSGSSLQAVEKGVRNLARVLGDAEAGLSSATDALAALGLTAEDLAGLSPEEQFLRVAQAVSEIPDPTRRAAAALDVLGRSGAELLPLFAGGRQGIADLRAEAQRLGLTIDRDTATRAAKLGDAIDKLTTTGRRLAVEVGSALAPELTRLSEAAAAIVPPVVAFVRENPKIVVGLAAVGAAAAVGSAALFAVGTAAGGLAAIAGTLTVGVTAATAALAAVATPLGAVAAGVAAVGAAFVTGTETGRAFSAGIRSAFTDAAGEAQGFARVVSSALSDGRLSVAATVAALGIKSVFQTLAADLLALFLETSGRIVDELATVGGLIAARGIGLAGSVAAGLGPGLGGVGAALSGASSALGTAAATGGLNPGAEAAGRVIASGFQEEARKSAEAALEAARRLAELSRQQPPTGAGGGGNPDPTGSLSNAANTIDRAASRLEAAGSFASGAAGLNTASGIFSEIKRGVDKIAEQTRRIADAASDGGLAFE